MKNVNSLSPLWKITIFLAFSLTLAITIDQFSIANSEAKMPIAEEVPPAPNYKFGFMVDTFTVTNDIIQSNQFLSDILVPHKVDLAKIDRIAKNAKDVFDVRSLRANKPFTILNSDTSTTADYFIYQPNAYRYVVYDLKKETTEVVEHKVEKKETAASGIVESSLWNAMVDNGMSFELTSRMEDALAWSVDFHHIKKGDRFKLVYEEDIIDGKIVGIGDVKAAYYATSGNEYFAIYFENEKHRGYYDLEGRTMEGAFLKAPVKYSRISSRYGRRYHPVLKRTKAHLGTDYAAPRGTPIFSVADGVVIKRSRTRGNGNYVKIKHDKVYQTQYLHMSRFAKGVTVGTHVKQGQTIGYVGSTGLATGPHVCFRFWKNGKQVNHLRENLPPPEPMAKEDLPKFMVLKDIYKQKLDDVPFADEQGSVVASSVLVDSTSTLKNP